MNGLFPGECVLFKKYSSTVKQRQVDELVGIQLVSHPAVHPTGRI